MNEYVERGLGWLTGLALLGPCEHTFTQVQDVWEPTGSGAADGAFISKGYDETQPL